MSTLKTPFRYDFVGSFLRPEKLKAAKKAFEGVTHEKDGGGVQFNGEMADLEATYLVGKVKAKVHPFVEYFKSCKTARNMVY